MSALIWHPDALDDVVRLYEFLTPQSPEAPQRAASVILKAADLIAENPSIGELHLDMPVACARVRASSASRSDGDLLRLPDALTTGMMML
jgi:toxin ParE1/3/4